MLVAIWLLSPLPPNRSRRRNDKRKKEKRAHADIKPTQPHKPAHTETDIKHTQTRPHRDRHQHRQTHTTTQTRPNTGQTNSRAHARATKRACTPAGIPIRPVRDTSCVDSLFTNLSSSQSVVCESGAAPDSRPSKSRNRWPMRVWRASEFGSCRHGNPDESLRMAASELALILAP